MNKGTQSDQTDKELDEDESISQFGFDIQLEAIPISPQSYLSLLHSYLNINNHSYHLCSNEIKVRTFYILIEEKGEEYGMYCNENSQCTNS
jgi:hypothetical protein